MNVKKTFIAQQESDLDNIAARILETYADRRVFALDGDLGTGKTTLIKALCRKLGVRNGMNSPTFAIANIYEGREVVYHLDFYRINKKEEALDIGYEEYVFSGSYCFIEWASKFKELLPADIVQVFITEGRNNERIITTIAT